MKFKNVKKTLYLRGAGTVLTLSLAAGTIAPAAPAFAEAQDSTVSEKEVSETDAARDDVSLGTEAETTAAAEAAEHTEAAASEADSPVSQTLESEKAESGTGETVAAETASNTDGTGETLPITDDEELLAEIIAEEISVDQLTLYQKGTYRLATVVNTDWLNIRADAGSEYKVVDAIRAGVTVTVYGEKKASDQRWKHHGIQQRFLSERDREGLRYRGSLRTDTCCFPGELPRKSASTPCAVSQLEVRGLSDRHRLADCSG